MGPGYTVGARGQEVATSSVADAPTYVTPSPVDRLGFTLMPPSGHGGGPYPERGKRFAHMSASSRRPLSSSQMQTAQRRRSCRPGQGWVDLSCPQAGHGLCAIGALAGCA